MADGAIGGVVVAGGGGAKDKEDVGLEVEAASGGQPLAVARELLANGGADDELARKLANGEVDGGGMHWASCKGKLVGQGSAAQEGDGGPGTSAALGLLGIDKAGTVRT